MMQTIFNKIAVPGFLLLLLVSRSTESNGQSITERVSVIGGVGNYEYLHGGLHLSIHHYFIEGAVGIKPWNFSDDRYLMEYISGGKILFQPSAKLNVALQLKLLHWDFNDDYTRISVVAIAPEIKLSEALSSHLWLTANGGIIYNGVLSYKRKTYEEVGWLNRFGPSFSLQLAYRL